MWVNIKKLIKVFTRSCIELASHTNLGDLFIRQVIGTVIEKNQTISHNNIKLKLAIPNSLCKWRALTLSTKEPETLEWIDAFPNNSILWDIGANIGLYSLYAAKRGGCQVWAFEPSVFNLEILARNIFLNKLTDKICIVPIALSDSLGNSKMRMTTTEWGGALSTFSQKFGWDGKPIEHIFELQTIGMSMDYVTERLEIPMPDFIKLDVDGLEHFILKGGPIILRRIKSILIEINDEFQEQSKECKQLLSDAGLKLNKKHQSDMMSISKRGFQNSYNQIWSRE
jgi:FkbM family methyltransferase